MSGVVRSAGSLIFGKMLPRRDYPVLYGPLKGSRFILGALSGAGGGGSVYFNQVEQSQTNAFVKHLKEGQVFYDIGANVGYYSILASRLVGKTGFVAAFEPVVRNVSLLQQHIELNAATNVQVLPVAVSDVLGFASFSGGHDFAMGSLENGSKEGDSMVVTTPLDEVVNELRAEPDVIKIDVEGAEMKVLKGAMKTLSAARPTIFLSTHSSSLLEECQSLLKGIGYEVSALSEDNPHELLAIHKGRSVN